MNYQKSWTQPGEGASLERYLSEVPSNISLFDLSKSDFTKLRNAINGAKDKRKGALGKVKSINSNSGTSEINISIKGMNLAAIASIKKEVEGIMKKLNIRVPNDVDMRVM